ncbi:hypothetical protein GGX14DRAFT_565826 [Mycena pura]|uniref:Expansin-like EG45 domain-containing protein n=1 Tax=Mycena pura TaxID=153505 RepID=A0AAD6VDM0_9AGAR|nr:hypothetical protein GGX14DRAFT_565826 [Mycena pura]
MLNLYVSTALGIALLGYLPGVNAAAGVTTFNDYTTQSGVACAGFSPVNSQGNGIFSAAMADLSPLWVGSRCTGSMNAANCNGHGACVNCTGSLDGETSGGCSGATIKVKIIDACPATHPANYCKIAAFGGTIPNDEACEASGTNALDIATTARSALSSFKGNLRIDIESTSC